MRHRPNLMNVAFLGVGIAVAGALWWNATPAANANRAAMAPSCCVGALDLNRVLEVLDERKALEAELQTFISAKENEIKDLQTKAQQAQDDLKILPEKSKDWFAKRDEVATLAAQFRTAQEVARAVVEEKRKRMHLDLFNKIRDAAKRYAQREGFMIVIADDSAVEIPDQAPERDVQGAMVSRRLMYADASSDISQGVGQMMNNEYKAR